MHFQDSLEKIIPLIVVRDVISFRELDGFRDPAGEIDQGVRRVAAIQGLVASRQPGESEERRLVEEEDATSADRQLLPTCPFYITLYGNLVRLASFPHCAQFSQANIFRNLLQRFLPGSNICCKPKKLTLNSRHKNFHLTTSNLPSIRIG